MMRVRTALSGWTGGPGLSTFYFQDLISENDAAAELAAGRVHAFWTAVAAVHPDGFSAQVDSSVDVLNAEDGELVSSVNGGTQAVIVGTITAADFQPAQTAVHIAWRTGDVRDIGNGAHKVKGGSFIGPLANNQTASEGVLVATAKVILDAAAEELRDNGTSTVAMVVWARPVSSDPTDPPGSAHLVNGHKTQSVFAHLKSRRQ
jgi:hypothetical protein